MNKTTTVVILLIIASVIITGCVGKKEETIKTPEGGIKVSQGGSGQDWCKAGTQITSSGPQGQGSFTIKGITKYRDKEVCEAEWTADQGTTTQYFTEDGSYTAMIMKDKSGKVINEYNYSVPK